MSKTPPQRRLAARLAGLPRLIALTALLALTQPELFSTKRLGDDVETAGEITAGALICDRRNIAQWQANLDVAVDVNAAGVLDSLLTSLEQAAAAE